MTIHGNRVSAPAALLTIFLCLNAYPQEETATLERGYRIGPEDLLDITVFELPELSQTVRVSEDGSISMPLLGNVVIRGLTKDEVEGRLSALLEEKNYIKNARVTVFIKEHRSTMVSVIGAVGRPGMYELIGRVSLLEMIAQAGGLTDRASNEMYILREGKNGVRARLAIDLNDLIINNNQDLNIPLMAKDVINVPIDQIINIFVFGAVRNPGALQVKMSKKTTLLQAIAQAGGTADGASKSGVVIKRKDLKKGKETKMTVNLSDIIKGKKPDIELREGDVVYVPESVF
ncbi:MAG TPA: polysaccharide biosynthesis/export family protein [Candidatus Aminicenantes bacterium]|nr:polysaccharide export protein [Acidobacteriota bacterium]HOI44086.1 polysaccharide biosynthesis/export family protein [Candidatus Aminicenantes bacterium]